MIWPAGASSAGAGQGVLWRVEPWQGKARKSRDSFKSPEHSRSGLGGPAGQDRARPGKAGRGVGGFGLAGEDRVESGPVSLARAGEGGESFAAGRRAVAGRGMAGFCLTRQGE